MIVMRGLALLFLVIGGALLALGLGGFADEWITANVTCGDSYSHHPCRPGEAQGIFTMIGGTFAAVSALLLVGSVWVGRMTRPLNPLAGGSTPQPWTPALATPGGGWTASAASGTAATAPATTAAGADSLVDRLARLADLRDRGILTDAEFEAQKARLL
jgi:hypothetical protein